MVQTEFGGTIFFITMSNKDSTILFRTVFNICQQLDTFLDMWLLLDLACLLKRKFRKFKKGSLTDTENDINRGQRF